MANTLIERITSIRLDTGKCWTPDSRIRFDFWKDGQVIDSIITKDKYKAMGVALKYAKKKNYII